MYIIANCSFYVWQCFYLLSLQPGPKVDFLKTLRIKQQQTSKRTTSTATFTAPPSAADLEAVRPSNFARSSWMQLRLSAPVLSSILSTEPSQTK